MDDPVVPFDLVRMFLGTEPTLFYLEIVFRTCLIYAYALAMIRWVGGRGIAQMSTVEFLLVIALGSAVGDAMFYPQVPLLHAMLVITVVILINKGLDVLIFRFRPVEMAIDGQTTEIIRDGVIDTGMLRRKKIGQSELFDSLRQQNYRNLGEVRRGYLETSGKITTFPQDPVPGLPIEPPWEVEPPVSIGPRRRIEEGAQLGCMDCGWALPDQSEVTPAECGNCGGTVWTRLLTARRRG